MIARRSLSWLPVSLALAAVLRAQPATVPAPAETELSAPVIPPPADASATASTATINPPAPAPDTAVAPTTPIAAPAAPAHEVEKPGILSAAKAKGPPPVGKTPAAPVPLSPRFQQIRTRINALFSTRNAPPPPPDPLANPFRPAGAVPVVALPGTEATTPMPAALTNDLTSLQQAVATLRVKGTVQRGQILQLVITSAPGKEGTYKEGDVINVVLAQGDSVHLRVSHVSAHSVTLTVNEAEMVLRF
jgi:hypothetical protein